NSRSKVSTSGSGYNAVASGAMGLTREEKRARHNVLWNDGASRSKYAAKKRKAGALLPGGALNVEAGSGSSASGGSMSVRARLAASQSGLIKLNPQKRDTRSIDEITRDLRDKGGGLEPKKVMTGIEAEKFNDWFSTRKDKEREREKERQELEEKERKRQEKERLAEEARERERKIREKERERERERERDRGKDRSRSGSVQAPSQLQPKRHATAPIAPKPAPIVIATKPSTLLSGGTKLSSAPKEYKVTVKTTGNPPVSQAVSTPTSAVSTRPRPAAPPATSSKPVSSLPAKRRHHNDSESDSYDSEEERERRRRAARKSAPSAGGRGSGFDIWSIINPGKSRTEYLGRDVLSDDEDMEATGRELEREEKQSARLAKQEDAEAEAEERRREEAKRRKKLAARAN
ncbi:hypothetical protein RSAG8_01153, partial [Rhizoctonia solani AG-8 WAC10335]